MERKVAMVNFQRQYQNMKSEIDGAIKEIMETGNFVLRRHVEEFEKNIASFIGTKHAIGVNSGTDAIFLSYYANLKPGDEVITVAHTFVATVSAIVHCGAMPVLIDIGDDMNMNTELLEGAITKRTKAIVPVHLNGRVCNMRNVMDVAEKYNLIVIEDSAQALGAKFDGKLAGNFGLTSCFSFYPAKLLGTPGDAGVVATNDDNLAQKFRFLRDHGQNRATGEILFHGFNSRLDNMHAAILDAKLKHVPNWIERRGKIAKMYDEGLSNIDDIIIPPQPDERFSDIYQNYVLRVTRDRDKLATFLKENGVETLIQWMPPMHKQKGLNVGHFNLPKTDQISSQVLGIPMHSELQDDEVQYVIDSIKKFYK